MCRDRRHGRVAARNRAPRARVAGPPEVFTTPEFGEIPIEGPERGVSALSGDLENEDLRCYREVPAGSFSAVTAGGGAAIVIPCLRKTSTILAVSGGPPAATLTRALASRK